MAYKIEHDALSDIVSVIYSGKVGLESRIHAVEDVCKAYVHLKPLKILVDVRELIMDLYLNEQEAFGEYLANHYGLTNARVAVLHVTDFNPNAVIDACAHHNGYKIAQFATPEDAGAWLLAAS